jgi:ubiquinone/menaquinone biosynthesis C-methylase UbiE
MACGAGDVAFALAERLGPAGRLTGYDLDLRKLERARDRAAERGLEAIAFETQDICEAWPARGLGLVYARFILTHLADPAGALRQAWAALAPGGLIAVEDIDYEGSFTDTPVPAFARYHGLAIELLRRAGGDPLIGRRLDRLLEEAGFAAPQMALVQLFGRGEGPKRISALTFETLRTNAIAAGLIGEAEAADLAAELDRFAQDRQVMAGTIRVFQAWARKPFS